MINFEEKPGQTNLVSFFLSKEFIEKLSTRSTPTKNNNSLIIFLSKWAIYQSL
jgi:hypothetical protein